MDRAEPFLLKAFASGDQEATVEYGNFLRASGRLEEAVDHFTFHREGLKGELQLRLIRWLGVSLFLLNKKIDGIRQCERAWLGYIAVGDEITAGKVAQNLAIMFIDIGKTRKAEDLLKDCINNFRFKDRSLYFNASKTLADLYIEIGRVKQAQAIVDDITLDASNLSSHDLMHFRGTRAMLYDLSGRYDDYKNEVERIYEYAIDTQAYTLRVWATVRLIDIYSRSGDFGKALKIMYAILEPGSTSMPSELRMPKAVLHRRRGEISLAIQELEMLRREQQEEAMGKEQIKIILHLAYAYYLERRFEETASTLREALEGLLRLSSQTVFKPELEEMSELLHYASMEPSLAPYLEPVMENLAGILGGPLPEEAEQVRLQVYTLGQVSVSKDGETVAFSLKGSVPLLVYLAQRPNRTRAELQLDLYPDKEPDAASAYIRQSIRELRELLGREVIIHEGPHNQPRYRLGSTVRLDLDLIRFTDAVQQGEMARALALYRGEFLPGMEESDWVFQQREEARLKLTFELKNQMAHHREQQEWRRVILLANQYLRVDPYEFEVHEWRVEAARRVGNTSELAKYVSQMNALGN